jgi:hypothetical protein
MFLLVMFLMAHSPIIAEYEMKLDNLDSSIPYGCSKALRGSESKKKEFVDIADSRLTETLGSRAV